MTEYDWNEIAGWVEAAIKIGGYTITIEEVKRRCLNNEYMVWRTPNAVAITNVINEGGYRELCILFAGGTKGRALKELLALLPRIEQYGQNIGCRYISILGRRSWVRLLRASNFRPAAVLIRKDFYELRT
jgi:hypothetical protein